LKNTSALAAVVVTVVAVVVAAVEVAAAEVIKFHERFHAPLIPFHRFHAA